MRVTLLIAACLWLAAATAEAQTASFRLPAPFPVGGLPLGVLVAKLNADEHLDIVTTNFDAGNISVLLGTGTGDFTPLDDMPASGGPSSVAALFADDDAFLDLLVNDQESDFQDDNVYLLRGNGDGTFGEPEAIPSGHDPSSLTTIDMNHDGFTDVVVTLAIETGGAVNVVLGDGHGNFTLDPANGQSLGDQSSGAAAGDFDHDGNIDVAATSIAQPTNCPTTSCGTLAVMLGDGTGAIAAPIEFATGATPGAVATADLDKDHNLDLVTVDSGDDVISVFKGSGKVPDPGSGDPPLFTLVQQVTVGSRPKTIILVDIDGDGWLEAVVANTRSGDISIVQGLPGGAFGDVRHFLSGLTLNAAAVGDFNEDTRLDLLGANDGDLDPTVSLLLSRDDGGFDAVQSMAPTMESASIAAGDVIGNGIPALVLSLGSANQAEVFVPNGVQRYLPPIEVALPFRAAAALLRDLNQDGRADLVVASANTAKIAVALATADPGFTMPIALDVAATPAGVVVADVDADGAPDLVASIGNPAGLSVLYGHGDGSFDASATIPLTGRPGKLAEGDFDGNDVPDLAISNGTESALAIVFGNRERDLAPLAVPLASIPGSLACADLDADGLDDLVVGGSTSLRVLFGTGNGAFTPGAQISTGRPPSGLAARDVTGDLRPDVLVSLQGTNDLAIIVNRGDRSFAQPERTFLGLRPGSIAVADFDNDGRYDVGVSGTNGWVLTSEADNAVRRGDGNADGLFSIADQLALVQARSRGRRVEDIRRGALTITAGTDANGDGLLDASDERLTLGHLFGS